MDDFRGNISLPDLIKFQDDILRLAQELQNAHDKIEKDMKIASYYWQDTKFAEFYKVFMTYSKELEDISTRYRGWAKTYLQDTIDVVIEWTKNNPR